MFAFVMPNIAKLKGALNSYGSSVNKVEKLTALDFFSNLPAFEQQALEKKGANLP